jgi:hypothetical protein
VGIRRIGRFCRPSHRALFMGPSTGQGRTTRKAARCEIWRPKQASHRKVRFDRSERECALPVPTEGTISVVGERNRALTPGHRPWEGGRSPKGDRHGLAHRPHPARDRRGADPTRQPSRLIAVRCAKPPSAAAYVVAGGRVAEARSDGRGYRKVVQPRKGLRIR